MEDVKLQEKIREFLSIDNGYGSGYGYGDGYGLVELNGQKIYRIDDTPTILTSVHGNVAKGYIMQSDMWSRVTTSLRMVLPSGRL